MISPRRLTVAAATATVALAVLAAPAAADPARPTSDRSRVERLEPPVDGISLRVLGGDAFLQLDVDRGVEVDVAGYGGEPYLRVLADGTVERNARSRATYLNEDRLGDVATPRDLRPDDEPVWERVASGGSYAWHDHRIHWMSPDRPPGLQPGDVIDPEWTVPLVVDGTVVTATGSLVWEEDVSPLPWLALAAAVTVAVLATAGRGAARVRGARTAAAGAAVAAAAATGVGFAEWSSMPAGAGGSALVVLVPAAGLAAGGVGLAGPGQRVRAVATSVSAAAVLGWVVLRVDVFLEPVLPTSLAPDLDRLGTALAAGAALAAATLAVRSTTPAP